MRHLKTYQEILRESLSPELKDTIWNLLLERITFPELYKSHNKMWTAIVELNNWGDIELDDLEEGDLISEEEYRDYARRYEDVGVKQKNYNFFIAYIVGTGDWYNHLEAPDDKPLSWYMKEFGQTRNVSAMMKAFADEDIRPLGKIGFVSI